MKDRPLTCLMLILSNFLQGYLLQSAEKVTWNLYGDDAPLVAGGSIYAEEETEEKPEYRLVMFSAGWCGPCRTMKQRMTYAGIKYGENPTISRIVYEINDSGQRQRTRVYEKVDVLVINTDKHNHYVKERNITSIPCFELEVKQGDEWIPVEGKRRSGTIDARKIREYWPEIPDNRKPGDEV